MIATLNSTQRCLKTIDTFRTADSRYEALAQCIKLHDNDISRCLDRFGDYIKADRVLIQGAANRDKYEARLQKMTEYLQKSTDIFFDKAQKQNSLSHYEKAARCAAVLTGLSDRYRDYEKVVAAYQQARSGTDATALLETLYKKVQTLDYPSAKFRSEFYSLVGNTTGAYETLEKNFQKSLTQLGKDMVARYLAHMRAICDDLAHRREPGLRDITDRYEIYKAAVKIPNVDAQDAESLTLRKRMGSLVNEMLTEVNALQATTADHYMAASSNELDKDVTRLRPLTQVAVKSFGAVKPTGELVLDLPVVPQNRLNEIDERTGFLEKVTLATKKSNNEEFVPAVALWGEALAYSSISPELRAKAGEDRARTIQTAVSKTVEGARRLAEATRYAEAADMVMAIRTALPLADAQDRELVALAKELVIGEAHNIAKAKHYTEAVRKIVAIREALPFDEAQKRELASQEYELVGLAKNFTMEEARGLAKQARYIEAIQKINALRKELPVDEEQARELASLEKTLTDEGRKYVLERAHALEREGKDMEALRTRDAALEIGMDEQLATFYEKLKRDFDLRQINNLEDAQLFLSCQGGLPYHLTYPQATGRDVYCAASILLIQQLNAAEYRGFIGGIKGVEVVALIKYPRALAAILEKQTVYAVFRITGSTLVTRPLVQTQSKLPLLELIYIQS